MENTDETTVHRSFRVPVELDEHIRNTEEHRFLKDKYFAVLRRGLNLPAEHGTEHTENTGKDWGGEIKELQQMITELQRVVKDHDTLVRETQGAMRQQHDALRILRSELKVLKSEAGFI